jgi:hypothetical protein
MRETHKGRDHVGKERHMWNNILKILIRLDDSDWIQRVQTVGSGEH